MSKREVCAFVGKSKRTIDSYIATGRLKVGYFHGPNGKTGIFRREDVEALKRDLETPTYRPPVMRVLPAPPESSDAGFAVAGRGETAVGAHIPQASALQHFLAEVLRTHPVNRIRPWLTLAEAVEYSGLPASYLLAQARAGKARAINVGSGIREFWRFHRASLAK